jgi:hypothetical protein
VATLDHAARAQIGCRELLELFDTHRAVAKVVGDFVLELSDGL